LEVAIERSRRATLIAPNRLFTLQLITNSSIWTSFIPFQRVATWWGEYYRRLPGSQGVLTLSRVGFNADRTQALFYFSNRCGGLCRAGSYVVIEKRGSDWVISKEIEMSLSSADVAERSRCTARRRRRSSGLDLPKRGAFSSCIDPLTGGFERDNALTQPSRRSRHTPRQDSERMTC
jgi:hypothetical protein